jgi:cystathionine gamma-synthase
MTNIDEIKKAIRPQTRLFWVETPSNPRLKITDIARVAEVAHAAGALCACDNTWSPIVQRPLDHGADLVMHSTTKYFGGHSDVLAGALVTAHEDEAWQALHAARRVEGACLGQRFSSFVGLSKTR